MAYDYAGKAEDSKDYCNPKQKLVVMAYFSKIVLKFQFEKTHTMLSFLC